MIRTALAAATTNQPRVTGNAGLWLREGGDPRGMPAVARRKIGTQLPSPAAQSVRRRALRAASRAAFPGQGLAMRAGSGRSRDNTTSTSGAPAACRGQTWAVAGARSSLARRRGALLHHDRRGFVLMCGMFHPPGFSMERPRPPRAVSPFARGLAVGRESRRPALAPPPRPQPATPSTPTHRMSSSRALLNALCAVCRVRATAASIFASSACECISHFR